MYKSVKQSDLDEDDDMDDRESIYLDTISVASGSTNRRSLALSRQTIYHSAEDLYEENNGIIGDDIDDCDYGVKQSLSDAIKGNNTSLGKLPTKNDEVSARLLLNRKSKKKTVTYTQWKARNWRRFQDGVRSVDYVLAYQGDEHNPLHLQRREIFEENLRTEGLELEVEKTQRIHFVKIHATKDVLCRYCEILKMKMPMRPFEDTEDGEGEDFHLIEEVKTFLGKPFDFVKLDPKLFPEKNQEFLAEFSRDKNYLFDTDRPDFFTESVRIAVVYFILERQKFSNDQETGMDVGIEKLISDGTYKSAYPLHDGDYNKPTSQRNLLFEEWASVRKWIRYQPLDNIHDYFGPQIALYFAWLGFYTNMLIPASIVGIICFLYGLFTIYSNEFSEGICTDNNTIIMCPLCDAKCDFWYLHETCIYSRISNLIDNQMTLIFAVFMSFWAILYLELWKRYSAKIIHRWGLTDYSRQAEHARPQYLARLRTWKKQKINVITKVLEPSIPFWKRKFPMYLLSFSVIFMFIFVAVAAVFGVIIYRMSVNTSSNFFGNTDTMSYKIMVLPATAAVINLVVITALNFVYNYLAVFLTNLEYRRTQTEYDESLSLKIYLFQFVNYYSSIFYIAFLKGKFVGYPAKYNKILHLRQEECSPGGCLMELCIQLVIIMVGKQALNAVQEMTIPFLIKTYNTIRNKFGKSDDNNGENLICCNQWTEDYKLLDMGTRGLFDDYLEMIIQYGFVTLFAVAFPLAPLFALINNIFEMRLDAKKFLKYYKRPVPIRIKDIGIWFNIMQILGKISVISSAFIIAFSTHLIPRLVYMLNVSPDRTDAGFLEHTLAYFNTSDFQSGTAPTNSQFKDIEICRYSEYRNPPWDDKPYKRPLLYWHVLAARLAFIVVFQNIVYLVQIIVAWAIPDRPRRLRDKIKKEEYLTREIIIEQEKLLANRTNILNRENDDSIPNGSVKMENELRQRNTRNGSLESSDLD